MEMFNHLNEASNFCPSLEPLFKAMKAGKRIKSVTCMVGSVNKNDPSKDFTIKDFVALEYFVGFSRNDDYRSDYVITDKKPNVFYMDWVREFEL